MTLDSGYYGLVGYTVPNEALIRIIQQANAGVFSLKEGKMNNDDFAVMFGGWYEIA